MTALNRYKYHLLAALVLIAMLLAGVHTKKAHLTQSADELPKVGRLYPIEHALELFTDKKAAMALTSQIQGDQRSFILAIVRKSLSLEQQGKAFEIARAVIVEAAHNHMDPLFLLAVISTESQFNIKAHGSHGEVGLMQVLPKTAAWLAPKAGLPSNFDLQEPAVNIRIGATYFAHLRHTFHHNGSRYVAAYNMGTTNVRRLLAAKTEPMIYATRVINNYEQIYQALNDGSSIVEVGAVTRRSLASVH